jgi:hypothetical protein
LFNFFTIILFLLLDKWNSASNGDRAMPVGGSTRGGERAKEPAAKAINPNRPMSIQDMDLSDMERFVLYVNA